MNEQYTLDAATEWDEATVEPEVPAEVEQAEPFRKVFRRELLLTAAIWVPALCVGGLFWVLNIRIVSLIAAMLAAVIHTLARREFPAYLLVFIMPLEWMVTVIHNITTVSKIVALFAMVVSLPGIIRIVFSRWDPSAKWIALLVGWSGFTILWAAYPVIALVSWQTMVLVWIGLPLLLLANVRSAAALRGILIIYVAGCLVSTMGILRTRDVRATVTGEARENVRSLVGAEVAKSEDVNYIARYLGIALLVSAYLFFTSRSAAGRTALIGAMLLLALGVITMKGRAVYVALPAAVVTGIMGLRGTGLGKRLLICMGVIALVAAMGFAAVQLGFIGTGIVERVGSIFEQGAFAGERMTLWRAHVRAFVDSGFIGVGIKMMYWASDVMQVAHNDWLSVAADLGIVGLAAFFLFHVTLVVRMLRIQDTWATLLCLMIWTFVVLAAMVETDFLHKYYGLCMILILLTCRFQQAEAVPVESELEEYGLAEASALESP